MDPFSQALAQRQLSLPRVQIDTLQVNVGKLCNQACHHCHVEAGPKRMERMQEKTADRILELLERTPRIRVVDITGGAPELNPYFKKIALFAKGRGLEVIDRCNLTIFYEPGQEELPYFLSHNDITVVASLPCYSPKNVDQQRGKGTFEKSIRALQTLNSLGYGKSESKNKLHLVYNPLGAFLPPPQITLENEYRKKLSEDFGISFNHLFTITNMPIKRFSEELMRWKRLEEYMQLLVDNFNSQAAASVMCRNLVSVGWDGQIYDCDFNQMLDIPIANGRTTVWDIENFEELSHRTIAFGSHCFGCTAGSGSSCGGSLTKGK